jgi:hypothetical protein
VSAPEKNQACDRCERLGEHRGAVVRIALRDYYERSDRKAPRRKP